MNTENLCFRDFKHRIGRVVLSLHQQPYSNPHQTRNGLLQIRKSIDPQAFSCINCRRTPNPANEVAALISVAANPAIDPIILHFRNISLQHFRLKAAETSQSMSNPKINPIILIVARESGLAHWHGASIE
jgi:hypothetical protein